ncbi:cytochrome P460 family protein [Rhodoplanes sp. Z2-YC6860]|uniref:cytochrome P460 family protein n=1 Tax=Rhodoplanes sp. Z2-YC6860 TaxID=674703 RepID=UPI00078BD6FF|nr:cytochrome P460 family protein [Rhodoplanes sp. Z2-YC6860]AMN43017.1 cytochrome P460 [Rhodoplanes sp. Z2-YC6860]
MSSINGLKTKFTWAVAMSLVPLVVAGGLALAAQNRSGLKVPNGLSFSEFKGYEHWETVAVSQTEHGLKAILANPAMIKAYRSGVPGNGKGFPDGAKIAKIEWMFKKSEESPYFVNVPDTLKSLSFIEKNTKRFPDTKGWAYAQFENDAATDTLKPSVEGHKCGFECHSKVATKDYIFTAYPRR